ncbi:sugar phosphate isomerase/epimerase family protein [Haladaptatus caseinilyticus]|uniref:sugar phosphate isomerase/epimerase family protein n=1 Tax=Haladaptatus caseinilyticus TaxID=2993314 RepID=UPI00224B4A68|nr:sugar phosphate isomerase/epimerase [Haladaptatus caseinilyticus]
MQSAIQFYTLRALDEPLDRTLDRVAETSLDGVEFGVGEATSPADIADELADRDLQLANLMAGTDDLENPQSGLLEVCDALDCDTVVLGYLDASYFESVERVEETSTMLSEFARTLDEYGLNFHYHNHDHEFGEIGGRTAFDILLESVDERVGFELDLGWIGTGGDDPYARLNSLGDRVSSVHVKDMHFETGKFVSLGEGDLNLDRAIRTAQEQNVEWVIYENDEPDDPVTELEHGADRLADEVKNT